VFFAEQRHAFMFEFKAHQMATEMHRTAVAEIESGSENQIRA